jgi:outer membrane receptor protein involved in Fe transport
VEPRRRSRIAGLLAFALACAGIDARSADNPAEIFELPSVQVVGTAPLPGFGTPLRDVPANVQIFDNRALARTRPLTLTQFLDANSNSVTASSGQGNPYQQSLDFRGFTASPLLGTPQGLSVFQDGVRINEPFGDAVNWDLLPRSAISSVQLIPGSVPAFGLNTLGGALAIYTKSGAQYPGGVVELSGGSHGRRELEFDYGHASGRFDAFATGHVAEDVGASRHSASRIRQFFGKLGFQDERLDLDVSATLADNTLNGAQTLPVSFLDRPRDPYTYPDINENRVAFVIAKGSRLLGDGRLVDANVFMRRFHNANLSSNVDDDFGAVDPETGILHTTTATNDRATTDATSFGAALQWTLRETFLGRPHQIAIGATLRHGLTRFAQSTQPAAFTNDRGTTGTGAFRSTTDVDLRNGDVGIHASDVVRIAPAWTLTVAARYDTSRVTIDDRTGESPALNGAHRFARLNPALGITFNPDDALTAYASYSESMRAPTPIELTCADPEAPCKLPNQFLADPTLAKVVSSTIESGARGTWRSVRWSAALYRSDLRDDLAFIASGAGATNAGYFRNVGRTRRQGIELAATVRVEPVTLALRYNVIDARFRSTFEAESAANSEADARGAIVAQPGDRIPGIPVHAAKLRVDWDASPRLTLGASIAAASSQYARGDENNRDRSGRVPGYAVAHVDAEYRLSPRVALFAQVDNLFDRHYANFGLLGSNAFTGPDRTFGPAAGVAAAPEQFRALGAPRGVFAGVRGTW